MPSILFDKIEHGRGLISRSAFTIYVIKLGFEKLEGNNYE